MTKILRLTFKNWFNDDPFTQSAAAAYYSIFSLPGLLVIIMALAAIFFDQKEVENQVLGHISESLGAEVAQSVERIIKNTQKDNRDFWGIIIGIATLTFGATGLFAHLQKCLNRIWEVELRKSAGWFNLMKDRLISFSLILVIGFLLLVSLSLTAALTIFGDWIGTYFSEAWLFILYPINIVISISIVVTLFSLMYKILPDAVVPWRAAIMGGVLSAILFTIGENALNIYFELAEPESSFGAAGSIILLMLWVSYSCMIILIGAEFSKTYMEETPGLRAEPTKIAKPKARL